MKMVNIENKAKSNQITSKEPKVTRHLINLREGQMVELVRVFQYPYCDRDIDVV